jgi:hypothetical protein
MFPNRRSRPGIPVAIGFFFLLSSSQPALAQTFVEVGGGWNLMVSAPAGDFYTRGISIRASIGRQVGPNLAWRIDIFTSEFDHDVQFYPPCAFPGCTHPYYNAQSVSVDGLIANAIVSLDPRGVFYVIGGAGLYDVRGPATELHVGGSVGAGIAVPVNSRLRAVVEARWHGVLGPTAGPPSFVPLTFGLRF